MQWWKLNKRLLPPRTKHILYISLCFFIYMWVFYYYPGATKTKVVILMWSKYYFNGDDLMKHLFKGKEFDKTCHDGVEITLDRGQLERATAIVMYHQDVFLNVSDLPQTRRKDQLWVLYEQEALYFSFLSLKPFNNLFNWTMTYRKDSDIFAPYGDYFKLDEEREDDVNGVGLDEFVSRKSGGLTAVISNCQTPGRRERFLRNLKRIMLIDIYGACGRNDLRLCHRFNLTCDNRKWWRDLGAKYKFYFAGENTLCTDYITEKFWRALDLGMVPVVYGGADYSRFAPPHSYIDVRDFESAKDVANFLIRLDENETEYKKYFEWRRKYKVRVGGTWQGFCDLSRKVKDFREKVDRNPQELQRLSKTIYDLDWWWNHKAGSKEGACDMPSVVFKSGIFRKIK